MKSLHEKEQHTMKQMGPCRRDEAHGQGEISVLCLHSHAFALCSWNLLIMVKAWKTRRNCLPDSSGSKNTRYPVKQTKTQLIWKLNLENGGSKKSFCVFWQLKRHLKTKYIAHKCKFQSFSSSRNIRRLSIHSIMHAWDDGQKHSHQRIVVYSPPLACRTKARRQKRETTIIARKTIAHRQLSAYIAYFYQFNLI